MIQKTSPANFWLLTGYCENGVEDCSIDGFARKITVELDDCPFDSAGSSCEIACYIPDKANIPVARTQKKCLVHLTGMAVPTNKGVLLACTSVEVIKRYDRKPRTKLSKGAKHGTKLSNRRKDPNDLLVFHTADEHDP